MIYLSIQNALKCQLPIDWEKERRCKNMTVQEQVAKMAYGLFDDNAIFLIDFMKKFMFPTNGRLSDDGYVGKKQMESPMLVLRIFRIICRN